MKTNTSPNAKSVQNTKGKNFLQKTLILLAVIAFSGFGFNSTAQSFDFNVYNATAAGCDWTITPYIGGTAQTSFVSNGGSGVTNSGCYGGIPDSLQVTYNGGGCATITFVISSGSIPYTAYTPSCSPPSCSSSIDCAGGGGSALCTAPAYNYLIQIL
jgi:hypothetical protein